MELSPVNLVLFISVLVNIVLFILNRRYAKKDNLEKRRYEVYTEYLNKVDEINESLRMDMDKYLNETVTGLMKELLEGNDSPDVFKEFNARTTEITTKAMKPMQIFTSEMNKVSLIGSKELSELIEEYKAKSIQLNDRLNQTLNGAFNTNLSDPQAYVEAIMSEDERNRLAELNEQIKGLMRKEIGVD